MLHLSFIANLIKTCRSVFPVAEYAYTSTPTYPSGQIGFMVCCKQSNLDDSTTTDKPDTSNTGNTNTTASNTTSSTSAVENEEEEKNKKRKIEGEKKRDVTKPLRYWPEDVEEKLCRYYNRRVHEASFVLPTFARTALR